MQQMVTTMVIMIKKSRVLSAILSLSYTATFQILNNVKSCLIGKKKYTVVDFQPENFSIIITSAELFFYVVINLI